jgi:hypothetical protein
MTDLWAALSVAATFGGQAPAVTIEQVDDVLTVEWRRKTIRPADGAVIFSGGVIARYGVTELRTETLTLFQNEARREGIAEGQVQLIDPDGTARAERLMFNWGSQTASGTGVKIIVSGLYLDADTVEIKPGEWVLTGVAASPDAGSRPSFGVRSPRVVYRPGKTGRAYRASFSVFGNRLITLPSYDFGGKRGSDGLRPPSISVSGGLGVTWRSSTLIDDRTRLGGGFRARRGDWPGVQAELTRSLLPRNEPGTLRPPVSDFGERFSYGYFDSLLVRRPSMERDGVGARRSSITLATTHNQAMTARLNDLLYSKPLELILEEGREVGGFGVLANARYQSIREERGKNENRAVIMGAVLAPSVSLGGGLETHLRFDTSTFLGRERFGWAQVQGGLVYRPSSQLRVGAAYVLATQSGRPLFDNDRLFSMRAFHGRMDVDFGSTRVSFLTKFDFDRRKWYDNEIGFSQVAGPIEPFVIFREFPRTVSFGVRFRADEVFDRIQRRLSGQLPKSKNDRP